MRPSSLAFVIFVSGVVGQSLTVPSTWRKPTSSRSATELARIAQAVGDSIKPYFNTTDGFLNDFYYYSTIGTAYSALARKDRLAGTQSNKWVANAIKTANLTSRGFTFGTGTYSWSTWGITVIDAYKAYGDPDLLQIAYGTWNSVAKYQISEDQARAGTHPLKSYSFVSGCGGNSVAGGVFSDTNRTGNMWLYASSAGSFARLSTLLADLEASEGRDGTNYKNAALLSANFLLNHLVDPSFLVKNVLFINGTTACAGNDKTWSENAGSAIETFSILADVTGDSKWSDAAIKTISGATTTSAWVANDGIVVTDNGADSSNESELTDKGRFLGSLYEPWVRTNNNALKSYITAFVNVQQNALLELATNGNSGFYSADWRGPAATSFTPEGTTAAACLTAIAIAINNKTDIPTSSSQIPTTTDPSHSPTPTESRKDDKSLAVPLGAGLGAGIPVLLLALLGLFLLCRRRQNRELRPAAESDQEKLDSTTQQQYPVLDSTPYVPPNDTQPTSPYTAATDAQTISTYASPPVVPVPMPSPLPTSVLTPPPGRIEFATASSGKETMYTWQGNQQPDAANSFGVASGYGANQIPGEHLPTDDLVRILNDRVSRGYEPQGDGPPVYLDNNR